MPPQAIKAPTANEKARGNLKSHQLQEDTGITASQLSVVSAILHDVTFNYGNLTNFYKAHISLVKEQFIVIHRHTVLQEED